MRNTGKRLLSLLLALVFCLSLLPVQALAEAPEEPALPAEESGAPAEPALPAEESETPAGEELPEQPAEPEPGAAALSPAEEGSPDLAGEEGDEPGALSPPALPQDGYAFLVQPESGSFDPDSKLYVFSWETSFTPVKIVIEGERGPDDWIEYRTYTQNLSKSDWGAIETDTVMTTFRVKAYYREYSWVPSEEFTVSRDTFRFVEQPESGSFDPDSKLYLFDWETSFKPVKIVIENKTGADEWATYSTLTQNLSKTDWAWIELDTVSTTFRLKAYYTDYSWVPSEEFTVSHDLFQFTTQPKRGFYNPGTNQYTATWTTNFKPTKVEIQYYASSWVTLETLTEGLEKNGSYTFDKSLCGDKAFRIRAYYDDVKFFAKNSNSFAVSTGTAPDITYAAPPDGEVGTPYSFQLKAAGSAPMTWTLGDYGTGLPPGLSLSSTGLISGTPTANGGYYFQVKVSNDFGSDDCVLGFNIGGAPVIQSSDLGTAYLGMSASISLNNHVLGAQVEWALVSGSLPPGIGLHGSVLVGTPTAKGTYHFTLRASNYAGSAEASFTLRVADPTYQVSVSPASLSFPALEEGYGYSQVAAASEIVFTNEGSFSLAHISCTLTGANPGAFSIVSIKGLAANTDSGSLTMAPGGHGQSSQMPVRVRRAYGLAEGSYTAELVMYSYGEIIGTAQLSFTVTEAPEPPTPQLLFEVDSGGKTWTLHNYHDNNGTEAGGWSSLEDGGPLKITVTKMSGIEYDLNIRVYGPGQRYFKLYGNEEFYSYNPNSGEGAGFTLHMPYSGTCSFYIWPDDITRGMDVTATLEIASDNYSVELPMQAIGAEPYVFSGSVTPQNVSITVEEGYVPTETQQLFTFTNTGTGPLYGLNVSPWNVDDPELILIEKEGNGILLPGESRDYVVTLAGDLPAGTYGGYLNWSDSDLGSVKAYYTVKVEKPVPPLTGKVTIVGSGAHDTELTAVVEGLPEGAVPRYEWRHHFGPGEWDYGVIGTEASYTVSHRDIPEPDEIRTIYCIVTCEGWSGQLESNDIAGTHAWEELSRTEPSCVAAGEIVYRCADEECGYHTVEAWFLHEELAPLGHVLMHVPAKTPTCMEAGNLEHWVCARCGELFLDETALQETSPEAVALPIDPDHHVGGSLARDADQHWEQCACGAHLNAEPHLDEDNDMCCDICEYNMHIGGEMENGFSWEIKDGILYIEGEGPMPNIGAPAYQPWWSYRGHIIGAVIQEGITSVGMNALAKLDRVSFVTIPETVTKVEAYSMRDCTALRSIQLPEGLTALGMQAFLNCSSLTEAVIPAGVTNLMNSVFYHCTSLTEVHLPGKLRTIHPGAFEGATALSDVWFYGTEEMWEKIAIYDNNEALDSATIHFMGIPVDEEHFPDEAFRGYVSEYIDLNGNGWLDAAEVARVTEIDCSEWLPASLEGVGYFTNLEVLCCCGPMFADTDGRLTGVDLSNNAALRVLDLGFNPGLKTLDLSNNPALEELSVGFTGLSELDLSNNPALTSLLCDDNALTALDLSNNPALKHLDCCGNPELSELDLSSCPLLLADYQEGGRHLEKLKDLLPEQYPIIAVYGGEGDEDYNLAVNTYTRIIPARDITVSARSAAETLDGEPMCEISGAGVYQEGQTVVLTPAAPEGWCFNGWYLGDEDVSWGQQYTVTLDAFSPKSMELVALYLREARLVMESPETDVLLGSTVRIPIRLENNPGLVSLAFDVYYDENRLEWIDWEEGELSGSCSGSTGGRLFWNADDPTADCTEEGLLLTLVFRVKEGAPLGMAYAEVYVVEGLTVNAAGQERPVDFISAEIKVNDHIPGDVNGDGKVSTKDFVTLMKHLAGEEIPVVEAALDVNGDGKVSTKDFVTLMKYLAGEEIVIH